MRLPLQNMIHKNFKNLLTSVLKGGIVSKPIILGGPLWSQLIRLVV